MAQTKLHGKDLKAYEDINIDELLSQLTDEQLEELHTDLIDPDDSMVPPSDRCRYKTDKVASGPFNRKQLLDYLEKKAREDKDWDEAKPYTKEKRGKVWQRKEEEKIQIHEDASVATEWDEVLNQATEEELVDLAAILGFHGMLNQVQYHQAFVEGGEQKKGGFCGVAKYSDFKVFQDEPPNSTDVEASLKQLKDNDPKLKELNLNNIKGIAIDQLIEFGNALKTNTSLEKFHLANTRATDKVAKAIAESLKTNKTLKLLNLESNYISGVGIIAILEAINANHTMTEFRVANQRPQVLGVRNEMAISQLLRDNKSLLRFGIFLEIRCARVQVAQYLQRNSDNVRRERIGEDSVHYVEETPYYLKNKAETAVKKDEVKKTDTPATKTTPDPKKAEPSKKPTEPAKKPTEPAKKAAEPTKKPEPAKKVEESEEESEEESDEE